MLENEQTIRLTAFLGMLTFMMMLEIRSPHRRFEIPKILRWSNNLALVVIDAIVIRLTLPTLAVGVAIWSEQAGIGLLNLVGIPYWLAMPGSIIFLDLAIYWQHVISHRVPLLWRLHRVHHSDQGFDASTALRFHPLEILLSMLFKIVLVISLGIPAEAVLLFEVILNGSAIFNHSNIRLPTRMDMILRWFIITPDMHRVHHSSLQVETDSNFGFNFPIWDWLFGTYIDQPSEGHDAIDIGLKQFSGEKPERIDRLMLQPTIKVISVPYNADP